MRGMAIPSMSDSSRLTEVPALAYLDEGMSAAGTECPEEPDLQPRALEELQPEGKQCQASAITTIEDDSIHSCTSNRSDSSFTSSETENKATVSSFRKRHRKHRMKNKNMRKKNEMCRKDHRSVLSDHITAECLSRPQQVTPDVWEDADISRLFLRKLNVDFFSTFESRSSISDTMDPKSDVAYIYAESIKGCDSSLCTMDTNNTLLSNNIHISNNSDCTCKSFSSEDSDCDLYVSGNLSGNSIEANAGSFLDEFNFESTCIYTEWDQKVDSTETELHYSLIQAEWGSASSNYSDFSCNTDTKSSSSDSDGCTVEAICDLKCPDGCADVFLSDCFDCCDEFGTVKDVCKDTESDSESGELWGVVTQTDRQHFSDFFCEMIKEETQEKDMKKMNVNEGFLFHPKQFLQVKNSEYREGREYSFLRHIQNGSYGDVFSIRDKQTGFTCAAKRIPVCSFGWQEVETWSRMESPRVLQLFGVVREGHNIILFMDLKRGSLAQLLRLKARLSEDLALYYHCQVLQALQHLHSRHVVHLDVKVDNVLLSEDGRQCFLCDFGLSETLNQGGYSTKTFRGSLLRGTESHMPPEVARGDPRSAKADVWSSCCMLLHMLSGHQPWTRYYPHPLCLKIVSEPPPLWEIPPDCDPLTCDVIKAGLVKEPTERDSASELLQKSITALRAVCGLSDPEASSNLQSAPSIEDYPNPTTQNSGWSPQSIPEDLSAPTIHWVSTWRQNAANEDDSESEETDWDEDCPNMNNPKKDKMSCWMDRFWGEEENNERQTDLLSIKSAEETHEDENIKVAERLTEKRVVFGGYDRSLLEESESWDGDVRSFVDDEEVESDLESLRELGSDRAQEWEPFLQLQTLYRPKDAQLQSEDSYSESEEESLMLRRSEQKGTSLPESPEPRPLSHTSCCDSEQDLSEEDSDDLSSGVFSSCSTTDGQSFNVDWSVSTNQTPSCYFEGLGVDIWVEDVSGECLKIRERPQVKIGHIAVGISEQISLRTFSLATLDGRLVSPDTEVQESGMWLQCVPAPDGSPSWDWRIRDGKLELQEYDDLSDTCSTVAL
ncbi:uncharacterized protein LOC130218104 isoform X1 [Danio aesculapii]|uniref:uncharacterized protein LOC130218104 isoform X1 n=2 Tax=Danio aesculapii TaxID=1142201 RepID=UPI0024BF7EAC|nr:uncharacterized protein LOC130218104 isoform X1 [Danio aesculapii]